MSPPFTVFDELSPSSDLGSTATPGSWRLQPARSASGTASAGAADMPSRLVSDGIRSVASGAAMNELAENPTGSPLAVLNSTLPTKTERPFFTARPTARIGPAAGAGRYRCTSSSSVTGTRGPMTWAASRPLSMSAQDARMDVRRCAVPGACMYGVTSAVPCSSSPASRTVKLSSCRMWCRMSAISGSGCLTWPPDGPGQRTRRRRRIASAAAPGSRRGGRGRGGVPARRLPPRSPR